MLAPDTVTEPPGRVTERVGSPFDTVMVPEGFFVTVNPYVEFGMYSLTRPLETVAVPGGRPFAGVATGPLGGLPPRVMTNGGPDGGFLAITGPLGGLPPWLTFQPPRLPVLISRRVLVWEAPERSFFPLRIPLFSR